MGNQVPKTNTPVSDAQMAQAIINVWRRLFGTDPSQEQVYMVMAQNAIETGSDRASMHNYNVGNIIVGNTDHDYFLGGDWMFSDKSETTKKKITQKFRAYNSLEEGVTDYLQLLSGSKRYGAAWEHIKHPDIQAYSKALHQAGYYGAKEQDYTKGLIGQLRRFNKGSSYADALSNKNQSDSMLAGRDSMTTQKINDFLQQFLGKMQIAATDHNLKKLYKSALSNNDILIQINAPDHTSAVEFSRVLCAALDEDLLSTSYPHTDGNLVEVECAIAGPQKECFEAVRQMTQAVADTFEDATLKVGGIVIKNNVIMNKKSSYQPISPRTAGTNYRKFLLKFV